MPPFPKPTIQFNYQVPKQTAHLRAWKQNRGIPDRNASRLLLATWNLANFGQQQRRPADLKLIAEILSWFDITAVQEVKDDFSHLMDVRAELGPGWSVRFSGVAGNRERMAFLYDTARVTPLEEVGTVDIPVSDYKHVTLPGVPGTFNGFDRNPYLATFKSGSFSFTLANVHLYFGSSKSTAADMARRSLETAAVARWASVTEKSAHALTRDVVALGDFNMPKAEPGDPVFRALTAKGLIVPKHSSGIGSSIASDNHYDQIAFYPTATGSEYTGEKGVFDYDGGIFPELWDQLKQGKDLTKAAQKKQVTNAFNAYLRYYISDHRPMWIRFRTT